MAKESADYRDEASKPLFLNIFSIICLPILVLVATIVPICEVSALSLSSKCDLLKKV